MINTVRTGVATLYFFIRRYLPLISSVFTRVWLVALFLKGFRICVPGTFVRLLTLNTLVVGVVWRLFFLKRRLLGLACSPFYLFPLNCDRLARVFIFVLNCSLVWLIIRGRVTSVLCAIDAVAIGFFAPAPVSVVISARRLKAICRLRFAFGAVRLGIIFFAILAIAEREASATGTLNQLMHSTYRIGRHWQFGPPVPTCALPGSEA